ncbi:MAG TPA: signal peptidase II [Clostridiaceae bacterium]|nr:signal peptidase II [Clostridiaceae bacterium]
MIWIVIILFITGLDQLTKYIVAGNIKHGQMIPVIDKFFYLTNVTNKGAAWSILQNRRYFLIIVPSIVSIVLFYILFKTDNRILKLSLSFILGGAIGNLIDRIFKRGGVIDFLDFHFGSYNFPTFNVADTFITIGTVLLAYYLLFIYKDPKAITTE